MTDDVTRVDFSERPVHRVYVGDDEHRADAVIIATGASRAAARPRVRARAAGPRRLATARPATAPSSATSAWSSSAAATRRWRRRPSSPGSHEGHARAPPRRAPRVEDHARPRARQPQDRVRHRLRRRRGARRRGRQGHRRAPARPETGETRDLEADGVFVAIGHDPNTALFRGKLDMDDERLPARRSPARPRPTSPGVFAAGDVDDHVYRQAITAAGLGLHGGARRRALAQLSDHVAGRSDVVIGSRRAAHGAGLRRDTLACGGRIYRPAAPLRPAPRRALRRRAHHLHEHRPAPLRRVLAAAVAERLAFRRDSGAARLRHVRDRSRLAFAAAAPPASASTARRSRSPPGLARGARTPTPSSFRMHRARPRRERSLLRAPWTRR